MSCEQMMRHWGASEMAATREDPAVVPIWAGEGIDLITERSSASDLVSALVGEAEAAIEKSLRTKSGKG